MQWLENVCVISHKLQFFHIDCRTKRTRVSRRRTSRIDVLRKPIFITAINTTYPYQLSHCSSLRESGNNRWLALPVQERKWERGIYLGETLTFWNVGFHFRKLRTRLVIECIWEDKVQRECTFSINCWRKRGKRNKVREGLGNIVVFICCYARGMKKIFYWGC